MSMLRSVLFLHWKSCRAWIGAAMFAVAALPIVSVTRTWPDDVSGLNRFLGQLDAWSYFYPLIAVVIGGVMATLAWRPDRQTDFVYALTLPVERRRYVGYRFLAGAIWIAAIAGTLAIAGIITILVTPIPDLLNTYPLSLALKFALATTSVFSFGFLVASLGASTRRNMLRLAAALLVALVLFFFLGGDWEGYLRILGETLTGPRGPLTLLGGRWMLIDV